MTYMTIIILMGETQLHIHWAYMVYQCYFLHNQSDCVH